jgi:2-hydroxycyclohexanecarboxyl-CoA dehydrogenase
MDYGLKDKKVVVTGGASNIGRAIALAFVEEGSVVAIADIDIPGAERVARYAGAGSSKVLAYQCDVTNYEKVELAVGSILRDLGEVDILVNTVGWTREASFLQKPRAEWEREIAVNLWGVVNCIRAVLPEMVERRAGRVVSVSSDAGRMGEYRLAVYSAAKAGIIALTKSLAREVGKYGITLNCVCPGLTIPEAPEEVGDHSVWRDMLDTYTPEVRERAIVRYPLRRLGTSRDIANAVLFLASKNASFITGQTLSVSGGYTMM